MRSSTAQRKGFRIRCPAAFVVGLSMVVPSPAAHGQKAWLDLRPLSGVSASGVHATSGWCGNVVDGTPCTSHAACAGDLNGEQCYQRITLFSDDQEVYFEAWISNWASFPNRTCWSPIGPPDTGNPCNDGNDCTGDEICGGSILTYVVGLDCSGYDNGNAVLEVPLGGIVCSDIDFVWPPPQFCVDLDFANPDWIHANAVSTIARVDAWSLCPQGEQPLPWFWGGSVVAGGIGNDGTLNSEAYLVNYAVKVPAGGTGTWELFLEDDQDDPGNVYVEHDAFPQDDYFVDFNIPLTITVVTGTGRCCGHPGASLSCMDGITGEECLAAGGAQFRENQSCSVDADGDSLDDACDNCSLFNPDQTDCEPNGIGDVCDIANCAGDLACSDCNNNGVPDGCELASSDCNGNGVPDECDIARGTSPDCNGNAIPDECDVVRSSVVFEDGFEDFRLDASKWCTINGADARGTGVCTGSRTLHLEDLDNLQSCDIDLSARGGAVLTYTWRNAVTEVGDDLHVLYWSLAGTWEEITTHYGGSAQPCTPFSVQLEPSALHSGFRIRFQSSSNSGIGHWFVDDLNITLRWGFDCNSNGVPDECDIAGCTGAAACTDCNRNGVPDECDIANGLNLNCDEPVPTVSTWGLVILALLLTVAGKVYFGRRRDPMTA